MICASLHHHVIGEYVATYRVWQCIDDFAWSLSFSVCMFHILNGFFFVHISFKDGTIYSERNKYRSWCWTQIIISGYHKTPYIYIVTYFAKCKRMSCCWNIAKTFKPIFPYYVVFRWVCVCVLCFRRVSLIVKWLMLCNVWLVNLVVNCVVWTRWLLGNGWNSKLMALITMLADKMIIRIHMKYE